jgi:hypothetical protein
MTNGARKSKVSRRNWLIAAALVTGGFVCFASADAFAAGTLVASPHGGIKQGEVVTVTGTGLAASSYGYVIECNDTPGEPTVLVRPPFDQRIPVGCSPPNLKYIVSTSSTGSLSTTIKVHVSRNLGPPCSIESVFGPCGGVPDSAGFRPRADAQNYPCPPSPAQQAAGVGCSLVFYDTAHQQVSTPITFLNLGPPAKTPPTPVTTPSPPLTTPVTTPAPAPAPASGTTPTPAANPGGAVTPSPALTSKSTGGGTGSSADPGATAPGTVAASSGSLAFTGLGPIGKMLGVLGAVLLVLGLIMLFVNMRRVALWLLGL